MANGRIIDRVRDAGVVGAGGAGFPTHVKLNCSADTVIANGAECEPLLRTDRHLMETQAEAILAGLELAVEAVGAERGIVATKAHYEKATEALKSALARHPKLSLHSMKSYYPAGDEKSLIYEVTGRVVPTGKLPADVGVVVCNVSSLVNIERAYRGEPVITKLVTVTGAVQNPATYEVPIGTDSMELLRHAGAPAALSGYVLIVGGPCMGKLTEELSFPVTKTTGGLILLPKEHPYVQKRRRSLARQLSLARAVCCQCSQCTQLCPRNALGLNVAPHKAMRALANANGRLVGDPNAVLACCSCGLCTNYACNFGLDPAGIMALLKDELAKQGVKPQPEAEINPDPAQPLKKVSTERLLARLGLNEYDAPAPLTPFPAPRRVRLPLRQHIGAPAEPLVSEGEYVTAGDLVAMIPQGKLGANLHASISGRVLRLDGSCIELEA